MRLRVLIFSALSLLKSCSGNMGLNGTSAAGASCYSGIYGTCSNCDAAGSCICGFFESGHSDMLPMDRTRWDGIVYVCSIDLRLYYCFWVITLVVSMLLGACSIYGLRVHVKTARRMNQSIQSSRIIRFCALVLANCLVDSVVCLLKIHDLTNLIGIDLVTSLLFCSQQGLVTFAMATHALHLTATALSTQELTLGRTRIDEAIVHAAWGNYLLAAASSIIFAIPLLGALISCAGEHTETQQQLFLVATILGSVSTYAANLVQQVRRVRYMLTSYDRSIEALKASLIIACGGASFNAASSASVPSPNRNEAIKPAHVVVIENDIQKLESARRNVRVETQKLVIGATLSILLYFVFLIPHLWSRHSYSMSIIHLLTKITLYPILNLYLPKRKRETPPNESMGGQNGSSPAGVVQNV